MQQNICTQLIMNIYSIERAGLQHKLLYNWSLIICWTCEHLPRNKTFGEKGVSSIVRVLFCERSLICILKISVNCLKKIRKATKLLVWYLGCNQFQRPDMRVAKSWSEWIPGLYFTIDHICAVGVHPYVYIFSYKRHPFPWFYRSNIGYHLFLKC